MAVDAQMLIRMLSRIGITLRRDGDKLLFRAPRRLHTDDLVSVLRAHKPAIMQVLTS